jgi:hypothetical protein
MSSTSGWVGGIGTWVGVTEVAAMGAMKYLKVV